MSRAEIIKRLKNKHKKLNNSHLEKILESFFDSITDALKEKKTVELRGFGTFFTKEIKEKFQGRNPKTGKLIYIPKKNKIRFRASKKLKQFINQ